MTETFLERIVATTRTDLAERKARVPLDELRTRRRWRQRHDPSPTRCAHIRAAPARLIAEIKRASPSKGLIAQTFDPVAQARAYERGGAAAISVLTEPHFFQGSLDHLRAVRDAVALPVLRKDFILRPLSGLRGARRRRRRRPAHLRAAGRRPLRDLLALTRELGMEALVEAHDADEIRRAVTAGATVIGVNSRDLRTFAVDTAIVQNLRPLVPRDRVFVAESGIQNQMDATRARAWGADAILVGEALMRAGDPEALARDLATASGGATAAFFGAIWPAIREDLRPGDRGAGANRNPARRGRLRAGLRADGPATPACQRRAGAASRRGGARRSGCECGSAGGRRLRQRAPETIAEYAERVGLDAVQLSGDESPDDCARVASLTGLPVSRRCACARERDLAQLDEYALAGAIIMLDTPKDGAYGGTGETGDWALAREAARRWPVILSGGLTPENVADAIEAVHPRGVDVSSGVETDKAKDLDKIARFIAAAQSSNKNSREQVGA